MTTLTATKPQNHVAAHTKEYAPGSIGTDWLAAGLSFWIIAGLYIDGWAHFHGRADVSFFTIWHATLYSGVLALWVFLGFAIRRGRGAGYDLWHALPEGYAFSAVGALLFGLGGVLDMIWHIVYGIEVSNEALLSPTHLLLATSAMLMITGPVRSLYGRARRGARLGWREAGPFVLSLTLAWSVLTFFTVFAHPINNPFADASLAAPPRGSTEEVAKTYKWIEESAGLASVPLQSALLAGALIALCAVKGWHMPFGGATLMIGLNGLGMAIFNDHYTYVPNVFAAGLLIDALIRFVRPALDRRGPLYLTAFAAPVIYYALYYAAMAATPGIGWSIHLWAGTLYMAGAAGLLVAVLAALPFSAADERLER